MKKDKMKNHLNPIPLQNELNPLFKDVPIANNVKAPETITIEAQINRINQVNNNKSKNIDFKKTIDEINNMPIASLETKMFDVENSIAMIPLLVYRRYKFRKRKSRIKSS